MRLETNQHLGDQPCETIRATIVPSLSRRVGRHYWENSVLHAAPSLSHPSTACAKSRIELSNMTPKEEFPSVEDDAELM